jgi:hypothetical protein
MSIIKGAFRNFVVIKALAASLVSGVYAQTTLQFTSISATEEGAIRLAWQSESNTVYRVDYADHLVDPILGYTVWQTLYDRYPSHGTNTFWLDTGNYIVTTPIPHPKYTTNRFYRIVNEGVNSGEAPSVTITSPTSGATLSGAITVSVATSTSYPVITTKLYVDGEEMYPSDDGTNYTFNTSEWPNGPHALFATAEADSDFDGPNGSWPINVGRAVSAYVPVTFNNLISKIAFSQPFFEPSLGQTQQITASFAANVNWTLQILDENTNAVRTVTGSGGSMAFNWDGTGDGGVAIPDGLYNYSITAQTNGQTFQSQSSDGGDSGSGGPPSPSFASAPVTDSTELFAMPADGSGAAVPLALYPPGFDTNSLTIFEASASEMMALRTAARISLSSPSTTDGSGTAGATPMYSGASSQSSTAPTRPWTSPVKEKRGDYSICISSNPTTNSWAVPTYGSNPLIIKVDLEGSTKAMEFDPIPPALNQIGHFCQAMKKLGWKLADERHDDMLSVNSIRRADLGIGGGELFTHCTVGLWISHGTYETKPDLAPGASGAMLTCWPSSNPSDASSPWLRMCQFGFGGNLKWMAILACNSLCDPNYGSMVKTGAIPLKETHLVCGTASIAGVGENIGAYWAQNMIKKNQTIVEAWFNAGRSEYAGTTNLTDPVKFRVAGYPECFSDKITNNTPPSSPSPAPGNLTKQDRQVFP